MINENAIELFNNKRIINAFVLQYERKRKRNYTDTCPIHGETEFSGNFNECIKCRRKRLKLIRKQQKEEQEMAINNTFCPFHGIKVNNNGRCPECDRLFNEIGFIL